MTTAEALNARNSALISLRDVDNDLRQMYPVTAENRDKVNRLLKTREFLCANLRDWGCEVWNWHPKHDNSWLHTMAEESHPYWRGVVDGYRDGIYCAEGAYESAYNDGYKDGWRDGRLGGEVIEPWHGKAKSSES